MLGRIAWTIDGWPLPLQDGWSANGMALGGFDQMRGTLTYRDLRRLPSTVGQGSVVTAYKQNGQVLWYGRLVRAPALHPDLGTAEIAAQGPQVIARKQLGRRLYMSRDLSLWADATGAPYARAGSVSIKGTVGFNNMIFEVMQATVNQNDQYPLTVWTLGTNLNRLAFTHIANTTNANYKLRVSTCAGPSGALTTVQDVTLASSATAVDITSNLGTDCIVLQLIRTGANSAAEARLVVEVYNVRVGSVATTDNFYGADVAIDVGAQCDYDTRLIVAGQGFNVLPLDVTGDLGSLLDYVAALEDRRWLAGAPVDATHGPSLDYGPYEREWFVNGKMADTTGLRANPLELYNQVVVGYNLVGDNIRHQVRDLASPDPLQSKGITNVYQMDLQDQQQDSTLAQLVADQLISRVSTQRWSGSVDIYGVQDSQGRGDPYDISPGDLLTVEDWEPGGALSRQRIHEVEWRPDGVTATVEARSLTSLLAKALPLAGRPPARLPRPTAFPTDPAAGGPHLSRTSALGRHTSGLTPYRRHRGRHHRRHHGGG